MAGKALLFELIASDKASPAFLRVAGAADKAAASTERATKTMGAATARLGSVGSTLTKHVTLPLLALGAVSVGMAAKFQQSTNVLVTAAGESTKNLALVRKGILDIAANTGTSWKSVTDGLYQLEKAGYRGAAALRVEQAAAQGAREEGASLATVTAAITSMMASYHLPASKAVMVMNEMKTAAGESKTTMEMFAGSLSTVLPLASANKISFADIAGSLASLTQHGTSADEAAQELAFTMRGLSAPNQVAIKEMAQLGISSVDVAKRLGDGRGGRGLAGTLNYLSETVLRRMGKSGTVLLSTFNASKVAAHDAQVEFSALAPSTQKVAKQFLAGTITNHDWTDSVKAMTPAQANLAKQWATTQNSAHGFQQALRSGVSGAQTYSDALKKMTGGANGLNTVLQLTGESAAGTTERIKRISDSAAGAGKNVSGWASTQKLFSVQMDMFKQSLSRTAIELGTKLLPVGQKMLGWIQSGVHWFDRLSGTDKKVLAWSAGILLALGPILSIGARLALVGSGIARAAGFIGTGLARIAGASSTTSLSIQRNMTRMTAALGGAGIGFGIGMLTRNSSNATKAIGVLGSTAAGAAIGFGAGGPLGAAIGGLAGGLASLATSFLGTGHAAKAAIRPTDDYTQAILADNDAVGKNTRTLVENDLQKRGLYDSGLKLGISQKTLTDAAMGNTRALALVNGAQARVMATVLTATGAHHALTKAQQLQNAASGRLTAGLGDLGTVLKVNQHAADNLAAADGKLHKSTNDVASAAYNATGKFDGLIHKGTGLDQALTNLARQHKINVSTSSASRQIDTLKNSLDSLYGAILNPPKPPAIKGPSIAGVTVPGLIAPPTAKGTGTGGLPDGWFTVGEQGYELGHKRGSKVDIYDNKTSQKMTGLNRVPGFATGTGGVVVNGIRYATQRAANNARTRIDSASMHDIVSGIAGLLAAAHNRLAGESDLSDAARSLRDAAGSAKISSSALARFTRSWSALNTLGSRRDRVNARLGTPASTGTAYERLATAQQAYGDSKSAVRAAVTGTFDISTAGVNAQVYSDQAAPPVTAGSILTQLQKAAANAGRFASLLKKLGKEGLNRALLNQLALAGPTAMDQAKALAAATPKQISQINSGYASLNTAGAAAGTYIADQMYGAGVRSAQGLVNGLLSQQKFLNAAIRHLGDSMVKQLKTTLRIHSPSQVMHELGSMTGEGYIRGVRSKIDGVQQASKHLAGAAVPGPAGGGAARGGDTWEFHAHGIEDPTTFLRVAETKMAHRQQMLSRI